MNFIDFKEAKDHQPYLLTVFFNSNKIETELNITSIKADSLIEAIKNTLIRQFYFYKTEKYPKEIINFSCKQNIYIFTSSIDLLNDYKQLINIYNFKIPEVQKLTKNLSTKNQEEIIDKIFLLEQLNLILNQNNKVNPKLKI